MITTSRLVPLGLSLGEPVWRKTEAGAIETGKVVGCTPVEGKAVALVTVEWTPYHGPHEAVPWELG